MKIKLCSFCGSNQLGDGTQRYCGFVACPVCLAEPVTEEFRALVDAAETVNALKPKVSATVAYLKDKFISDVADTLERTKLPQRQGPKQLKGRKVANL